MVAQRDVELAALRLDARLGEAALGGGGLQLGVCVDEEVVDPLGGAWGQAVATVGAIAGTKLTGGAEPALASQDSAQD